MYKKNLKKRINFISIYIFKWNIQKNNKFFFFKNYLIKLKQIKFYNLIFTNLNINYLNYTYFLYFFYNFNLFKYKKNKHIKVNVKLINLKKNITFLLKKKKLIYIFYKIYNLINKKYKKKKINFFFKKIINNYFFTVTDLKYQVLVNKSIGHFLQKSLNIKKRRKAGITLKKFVLFFKNYLKLKKLIKKCIFNKFFFLISNKVIFKYIRWIIYKLLFKYLYINEIIYIVKKAHNGTRKKKKRKL